MNTTEKQLEDLHEIRSLMERSGRFISLSGLSGIFAGAFALIGSYVIWRHFGTTGAWSTPVFPDANDALWFLAEVAGSVLLLSMAAGILFTMRNAKRKGQKVWDTSSKYMLFNLAIPLLTGGVFCLALISHAPELIAAAMLIFYGLALLNASRFTLSDIRYVGFCEIILGLICCFKPEYGLVIWAFGFGVLHIIYGTIMYFKYER